MNIDRRITNGLAWAGVLIVVGVPAADLISGQFERASAAPAALSVAVVEPAAPAPLPLSQRPAAPVVAPAAQVAVAAPVAPVAVKPGAMPAAATADAVDSYLQSGRTLPSYITGAPAAPAQVAVTAPVRTPIITTPVAVPVAPTVDPVQVAAIPPQKVAPVPMPLSMRPQPVAVALVRDPVVIPPGLTPASPAGAVRPPANVTAADLEDWESGPLSEFLAQRQGGNGFVDPNYDGDGFFLDQGPNQRPRRDRIIARESDAPFFLID